MKAEHRKELQTNALADRMGRLYQGMKSGQGNTSAVVWVLIGLTVVTFAGWYWATGTSADEAQAWVKLYGETRLADLQKVAADNRGTLPGRTAEFQIARESLQMGLERLCSTQRATAVDLVVQARDKYLKLRNECVDSPLLAQEATLGAAKSEEALVGIPRNADDPNTSLGDLNRALTYYRDFLDSLKKTLPDAEKDAAYQAVAKHVQELEKDPDAVKNFYAKLDQLAQDAKKKDATTAPPKPEGAGAFPGLPPEGAGVFPGVPPGVPPEEK
jgi:hypothetical protein